MRMMESDHEIFRPAATLRARPSAFSGEAITR
jgi:hypothetical protein